jgi:flagellar motor protein MotB
VLVGNPPHVLKKIAGGFGAVFGGSKFTRQRYLEALKTMYDLFNKARREGLIALESDVEEPEKSPILSKNTVFVKDHHVRDFVCDTVRMAVTGGIEPFELQNAVRKISDFENLKDHIEMTVTAEGLRIELMESESGTFFESGSSAPSVGGKEYLIALAHELSKLPNKISIEGHTDSKPFAKTGNYGNWELSADRANAARRLMQQNGVGGNQVAQIHGYADQQLRKDSSPEDPSNRRISLIIQYLVKEAEE